MMFTAVRSVGHIKAQPEDFVVQEEMNGRVVVPQFTTTIRPAVSPFTAFTLTKRNVQAVDAYREVARQLGVSRQHITECGRKDKVALTTQTIVVEGTYLPQFNHADMWLTQIGPVDGPLWHGAHSGNRFSILVRTDAPVPPDGVVFRNLFGHQRFWGRVDVGRYLLEGQFDQAVRALEGSPSWYQLKRIIQRLSPASAIMPLYQAVTWDEVKRIVRGTISAEEVLEHPDFREQVQFEVLKWQSHLWNRLALRTRSTDDRLPMWGLDHAPLYTEFWNPSEVDSLMYDLTHQFSRRVWVRALRHQINEHELGYQHEFTLPSGSYATVFLDHLYALVDDSREGYVV